MLNVIPIPAFNDNYIWCVSRADGNEAVVVDPGDATPVRKHLAAEGLTLAGIIITHHHFDHTGGIEGLLGGGPVPVWGPHNPGITAVTTRLAEGDEVEILGVGWRVLEVPGHTLDHIAFYSDATEPPTLFCGDTLFAGGCGRVFEGNPGMMLSSLDKLASLPPATRVYCAHEYTMANLAFAEAVEPDNAALIARKQRDAARRESDQPTVPSEIALELDTNPFLRCRQTSVATQMASLEGVDASDPVAVFAAVRGWKDRF
jgi:hydroxyacylglutathione hydrolase